MTFAVAVCADCGGTGWVLHSAEGERLARECECRKEEARGRRFLAAQVPERYRDCSFSDFKETRLALTKAKAIAQEFAEAYPVVEAGLLFLGPAGIGKTHLAIAILNEITKTKGRNALYVNFADLLMKIQSTFKSDAIESKEDVITPYSEVELLVLDELGATKPSEFARDMLYALLNTRYNHNKVTVATSNFMDELGPGDREKLEDRIGYRLRSRLHEMCQTVLVTGEDFRKEVKRADFRARY